MLKLVLKFVLFSTIILGICYSSFYLKPNFENDYMASLTLKLDKLEKIEKKKIVIIGGSNACIGINSELMENNLGVPVVNTALHATLGSKFWIEYVKGNLNEGDIVIMSPEYGMLDKKGWYGMKGEAVPKAILFTPSKLPILLSDYTFFRKTVTGIFRSLKAYWKEFPFEKRKHNIKYVYDLRSFDEDNIRDVYLNAKLRKQFKKIEPEFKVDESPWEELKEYKAYFDKRNIKFYLTLPSVLDESIDVDKAKSFFKSLSEQSTVPIVNNNYNYFFKRHLFHDSNYHLNGEGIKIRTNRLIDDINAEFYGNTIEKDKSSTFFSQNDFEIIDLSTMTMTHNVKTKYFSNDSILITPIRDDKLGFIKYKTDFRDYIGSLLKITVKCDPQLIAKLRFRGGKNYDFDYMKRLDVNTFELCKNLSNVIIHPLDYSSTSIGIGYDDEGLTSQNNFTIVKAQIIGGDLNCNEVSEYVKGDYYGVNEGNGPILFKVKSYNGHAIGLKDVLNIDSDLNLMNNQKYVLDVKKDEVILSEFYKDEVLMKQERNFSPVKFINSKLFELEVVN